MNADLTTFVEKDIGSKTNCERLITETHFDKQFLTLTSVVGHAKWTNSILCCT